MTIIAYTTYQSYEQDPDRSIFEEVITGFTGFASHGAAIGIPIAMYFYAKKHLQKPWLFILDRLAIMVALAGFFIRFGNFFNSLIKADAPRHS